MWSADVAALSVDGWQPNEDAVARNHTIVANGARGGRGVMSTIALFQLWFRAVDYAGYTSALEPKLVLALCLV